MLRTVKKLKNDSGMSILFALLFFLVVAMISAVILTASSVNLDKNNKQRKEQQAYLSVSSAARLIRSAFGNTSCSGTESLTIYGCTLNPTLSGITLTPKKEADISRVCNKLEIDGADKTKLKEFIVDKAYKLYLSRPKVYATSAGEPAFVTAPGKIYTPEKFEIKSSEMSDVDVAMVFDRNYNITMQLTVPGSDYAMTLRFSAILAQPDRVNPTETTGPECSHSYTRTMLKSDGTYEVITNNVTCVGKVETLTTKISWDGGTVIKGVVK